MRQTLRPSSMCSAVLLVLAMALPATAQEPKSAALAKELSGLMQQRKLDSAAARLPDEDDRFVAVLLFPGQLLLASARTAAPAVIKEKLVRREYRDVYIDLNSASIPESRVMVTDGDADGLRPRREPNSPFDTYDADGVSVHFDGNWREDRMSEKDYMAAFAKAEAAYIAALSALVSELKKGS